MAIKFPSDEWVKELQQVCCADDQLKAVAEGFSARFIFQVDPEPGKLEKPAYLYIHICEEGAKDAAAISSIDERPDADYAIGAKYPVWQSLLEGNLSPFQALMARKMRVTKGSQLSLMKRMKPAMRIMTLLASIETEY